MRRRDVFIGINLETTATLEELRKFYWASICDRLATTAGVYSKVRRVEVMTMERALLRTPEGGAA